MKKYIIPLAWTILAILLLPACEKEDPPVPEAKKVDMKYKSAQILDAGQAFSFEIFKEVYELSEEENIMISPLSISYALGMTYNGAKNSTREAFEDVLHFGDLSLEEVNQSYHNLMSQFPGLDPRVDFSIANSIWYRLGFDVVQEFIDNNTTYFDSEVRKVDFTDPGTLDLINGWIEDKTNDKIQDMLDYIPSDAVMYLINALYFNAPWKYEFDRSDTYEENFQLGDGGTSTADFMQVEASFMYTTHEHFTAVELPYGDSAYSMLLMLPAEGESISDLLSVLDGNSWNSLFEQSWMSNLQLHLPKFKHEFKMLLNDPLINLGLGDAFSSSADFTGITPSGNIYISRVIHQTFIDVMEEGTEAAAATIVELRYNSAGPTPLVFNRPFLYMIKENSTGAILFVGKVGRPVYEN